MKEKDYTELLEISIHAAIEAGIKVLEIYEKGFEVEYKEDDSPLTSADTASNNIIVSYLDNTDFPILSEEGKSIPFENRKSWESFWIVDPLDGTKEFIKRNGEFTINIALVENGVPVLGVIYIPVQKTLYFSSKYTSSSRVSNIFKKDLKVSLDNLIERAELLPIQTNSSTYRVVGSKSHLTPETQTYIDELKSKYGQIEIFSKGSSLKICMVAEGAADIYPRFAPTMEWDIAAGHAIALYAGKHIVHYKTKKELTYNSETLVNPWFIVF